MNNSKVTTALILAVVLCAGVLRRAVGCFGAAQGGQQRQAIQPGQRRKFMSGQVRVHRLIGNSSTVTEKRSAPAKRTLEQTPFKKQPPLGCVVQLHRAALPSPLRQVWDDKGKALGLDLRKGSLPEGSRQTAPPFGLVA